VVEGDGWTVVIPEGANVPAGADVVVVVDATDVGVLANVSISYNGAEVALGARVSVGVELDNLAPDVNPATIIAFDENGAIVGGSFYPGTGVFTFATNVTGEFTIMEVPNVNRFIMSQTSLVMFDITGNASPIIMDVLPQIVDGRKLVPMRFIADALGGTSGFNRDTRLITFTIDGVSISFFEGDILPGMDVAPQVINGRTMVPVRWIANHFGAFVRWDSATQTAEIIRIG
jgi:hypothetical protein